MPLTHYSKFSMFTLRIWVFKPGVIRNVFILSKHGTTANIRITKMRISEVQRRQIIGMHTTGMSFEAIGYTPKPLLSLHRKGQLAGCSLGYRLYFCVSKPSSRRRLYEAENIRDVWQPVAVPHFDNHPLATRPVYMDDNARPHLSRAVTAYLQSEAVTSVPWSAMSPDLNRGLHVYNKENRPSTHFLH
jgi:hypothetical protein